MHGVRSFPVVLVFLVAVPMAQACTGTQAPETQDHALFWVLDDVYVTNLGSQRICIDKDTGQWHGCGQQVQEYMDPCSPITAGTAQWDGARIEAVNGQGGHWAWHATGARFVVGDDVVRAWGPAADGATDRWQPLGRVFENATHAFVFDPGVGLSVVDKATNTIHDVSLPGQLVLLHGTTMVLQEDDAIHLATPAGIQQTEPLAEIRRQLVDGPLVAFATPDAIVWSDGQALHRVDAPVDNFFGHLHAGDGQLYVSTWDGDAYQLATLDASGFGAPRSTPGQVLHIEQGHAFSRGVLDNGVLRDGFTIVLPDGSWLARLEPHRSDATWLGTEAPSMQPATVTQTTTITERIDAPLPAVVAIAALGLALVRRRLH